MYCSLSEDWCVLLTFHEFKTLNTGEIHKTLQAFATWLPMCSKSWKPRVTARAQRSPLRSSKAFVATCTPGSAKIAYALHERNQRSCAIVFWEVRLRKIKVSNESFTSVR